MNYGVSMGSEEKGDSRQMSACALMMEREEGLNMHHCLQFRDTDTLAHRPAASSGF